MQKNKITFPAFTLVEVIVVITILSVLSTIGFLSFQGYGINSRDAVRLSDMSNIVKGLSVGLSKGERLPIPEDKIDITASGTILTYQGYAGQQILGQIGVQGDGVDPLDESFYTYATNRGLNLFQILGHFEQEQEFPVSQLGNTAFADLTERYPQVQGDEIGILIDSVSKEPVQETGTDLDVVNTIDEYELYINNTNFGAFIGTGPILIQSLYNNSSEYFNDKQLAKFDESLEAYWDMETVYNSGGIDYLKDYSKNNYVGTLIGGINIGNIKGIDGKGTYFDGEDDKIQFSKNDFSLSHTNKITVMAGIKAETFFDKYTGVPSEIFRYGGNGTDVIQFRMRENNIFLSVGNHGTPGGSSQDLEGLIELNKVYHIAFTYNGDTGNMNGYLNGKLINNTISTHLVSGFSESIININIGDIHSNSETFQGMIDELRIYNRDLSEEEIKNLYNFY